MSERPVDATARGEGNNGATDPAEIDRIRVEVPWPEMSLATWLRRWNSSAARTERKLRRQNAWDAAAAQRDNHTASGDPGPGTVYRRSMGTDGPDPTDRDA